MAKPKLCEVCGTESECRLYNDKHGNNACQACLRAQSNNQTIYDFVLRVTGKKIKPPPKDLL